MIVEKVVVTLPMRDQSGDTPRFDADIKHITIETTSYDWLIKISAAGIDIFVGIRELRDALKRFDA